MTNYPDDENFQTLCWLGDDEAQFPTKIAERIFREHFPDWARLFVEKNAHYGELSNDLGVKAQFVDIYRKVGPLKRILWDGEKLPGEGAEEMLKDLIGHCFLTLDLLAQAEYPETGKKFCHGLCKGACNCEP